MKEPSDSAATTAARLRDEFDRGFARPFMEAERPWDTLISIRVREDPFALRLSEIAGLFVHRALTRLPSPFADLLGVTGFRGAVVPVFDLGALLGYPLAAAPRWLILSSGSSPIGLAFDGFDGTERITAAPVGEGRHSHGASGRHLAQVVPTPGGPRPIVDIPSILDTIDHRITKSDG